MGAGDTDTAPALQKSQGPRPEGVTVLTRPGSSCGWVSRVEWGSARQRLEPPSAEGSQSSAPSLESQERQLPILPKKLEICL